MTTDKEKAMIDIIDYFLADPRDYDLRYEWSLRHMIKHNIFPTDIYDYIDEKIFWNDRLPADEYEDLSRYDAIMNVYFSNRLALRHEAHYNAKLNEISKAEVLPNQ